ncbi:hypothetical protein Clacol_000087 [Clathrus columnatus]|uniref:Uncharacterized protein n=1 Tax=Clathrus columnatus TaxID=1419009 RepID=A0AAV4ZYZ9_9AGAM|nr:hypothetical protein Clacol_000087 [Clathrus columnatus]
MTNIVTNQGNNLDIDFISIGREIGPPGFTGPIFNVTIDDESPFVTYNGSWSSSSSSGAFNNSLHSTIQEGSSVSVLFQGSSIELYGLYVNAPLQAHIDKKIPVDLAGPNETFTTQSEHPQTLLFLADGLDENEIHSATLVNSVSDSLRPLYFDFAIVRGSQKFFENTSSPNPNFTIPGSDSPTSTNGPSARNATSPSIIVRQTTATATIVGGVLGGVAGLIVSAFIAFIFFRRSKYYHRTTEDMNGHIIPPSDHLRQHHTSTEPIPFIFPVTPNSSLNHTDLKSTINSNGAVPSQQPHSQPGTSSHGLSQQVTLSPMESIRTEQFSTSNSLYSGNSVTAQTYTLQEQDAGRLAQTRLPPIYDDIWAI